jgi:class 3 adenylate cyclase/pimeloyl-ACP methyl ester carboxylesterase
MPNPEVRYCTTEDGVRIAYCVEGEGPPIVECPHLFESFALEHVFPQIAEIRRLLAERHQVVRYDMRGTGLSQREVDDVSHAALVLDLDAVVKATGLTGFALTGTAFSGARAIEYAVRHPERLTHLILWGASARFSNDIAEGQIRGFAELARTNWSVAAQAFADLDLRGEQEVPDRDLRGFGRLLRQSVSGEMAARIILELYSSSDVRSLLQSVSVPTLVIDRQDYLKRGQELAANIPGARFLVLGNGSSFVLENARPGIDAIRAFLGDTGLVSASEASPDAEATTASAFRTVLFTDIVGHTEMMQRLGDEKGRAVLREHERITREVLKAHGGAEIKTDGDSFMVSFSSVTKAVECAIALQRAFEERNEKAAEPLEIRAGLNAGEPIAEEGDLFGSTVILAARVAAQAGAGEILIPEPVRHLLSGKQFLFSDRGDVALKGFEDAVRLYEVRWREEPAM